MTTTTYPRCQHFVVVHEDAQGVDLCESLDLPEYPSFQCPSSALEGSDMCAEHDAFASDWD
jgi:hypothetical protein